jgi:hypothetical protein
LRQKSENEARDRYSRRYAAVLAADALIKFRARGEKTVLTVEAEDHPLWDDILQVDQPGRQHRHQVKRQQTALASEDFKTYVKSAAEGGDDVEYHFAFPVLLSVDGVGEIRTLRTLCERVRQVGANHGNVLKNLREAERDWVDFLTSATGLDELATFRFLCRLHIDVINYEEDLDRRAFRTLEPTFGVRTEEAWARILAFVADKDGVVEIDPATLWDAMPAPAADAIDAFYWSFIEQVESAFPPKRWASLSEHLLGNMVPQWFQDDVISLIHAVEGAAWPDRYPEVNAAIQNLSDHALEYFNFFNTRSESDGRIIRENREYKRIFPNPNYYEELEAAKAWDRGVHIRLWNMVVALNEFFAAVRARLSPTYRLRDGRLGIVDSMGITNDQDPITHYPKKYMDIDPEPPTVAGDSPGPEVP